MDSKRFEISILVLERFPSCCTKWARYRSPASLDRQVPRLKAGDFTGQLTLELSEKAENKLLETRTDCAEGPDLVILQSPA